MSKNNSKPNTKLILIAVNAAAFLIALIVFFTRTFIETEKEMTIYSALEEPRYPVISVIEENERINTLHAYTMDMGNEIAPECITPLPADRKLEICIDTFGGGISGLSYEIHSMDLSHFIEKTSVEEMKADGESVHAVLPIQNMLTANTQYLLTIHLDNGESRLNYYTRIVLQEQDHSAEMIRFALDFNRKTFHYDAARELISYLEIDERQDNSSLGRVTINSNFSQLTWGSTEMQLSSEPQITVRQLDGRMGTVDLSYIAERSDEQGGTEYYANVDTFTMRMGSERIYLMNYQRRTDNLFDGNRNRFSGKRISLGIGNEENYVGKDSDNARYIAFKANKDLWLYDQNAKKAVNVFSFRSGIDGDVRNYYDHHDIRILSLSDTGEMDFVVYGYMNRGKHEGSSGITYYRYDSGNDILEELFFIPLKKSYEKIKLEVDELCAKGTAEMFFVKQNGCVTGIDLKSLEMITYVSGIDCGSYAVSGDQSRVAWIAGAKDDSDTIRVLDIMTGETQDLRLAEGNCARIIGYSDNNLIYGIVQKNNYRRVNGRKKGMPMSSVRIVNEALETIKDYQRDNCYIDSVHMSGNRIYLDIYKKRANSEYTYVDTDTIVYNAPESESVVRLKTTDTDDKKKTWFIAIDQEIKSTRGLKAGAPSNLSYENAGTVELKGKTDSLTLHFYICNDGRIQSVTTDFAEAVRQSYSSFGYVLDDNSVLIYDRTNRDVNGSVEEPLKAAEPMTKQLFDMKGSFRTDSCCVLDAQGVEMEKLLCYVYSGTPLAVRLSSYNYCIIYAYDKNNVRILYPLENDEDKRNVIMGRNDAADYFSRNSNDFTCIVYYNK